MSKPLVSDELWTIVEPLLPKEPPKPKGGRPRVPARACLAGISFVHKSGISWEMPPPELGCGSGVTCWRRLPGAPRVAGSARGSRQNRLEPSEPGQRQRPGKQGGQAVGPNLTDRGTAGSKRLLVTDRAEIHQAFLSLGCALICWNYLQAD